MNVNAQMNSRYLLFIITSVVQIVFLIKINLQNGYKTLEEYIQMNRQKDGIERGMNDMRVAELIKKLQKIGYDDNTELTFSCTDGETGEYYVIPFEEITYGEELTGEPYENDVIDIGVDVDSVEEYIKAKAEVELEKQTRRVIKALEDYS